MNKYFFRFSFYFFMAVQSAWKIFLGEYQEYDENA